MLLFWYALLIFLTALIVVVFAVPEVQALALKYGWIDRPNSRKVHQKPMVRLGGIAICLGTITALSLGLLLGGWNPLLTPSILQIGWVLLGGLGFFLVGLLDDLLGLSPILRLLLQAAIASLVWWAGVQIAFLEIPGFGLLHVGWLSLPITVIWLTGVVNAINWIDGLDGLASGVCGIAALVIFIVCLFMEQTAAAIVMLAIAGSLSGFLYHNFNPAKIFMGDGGSYFIGFMIAGVSIVGLVKSAAATAIFIPFLILAVPLLDMSAVIAARLYHGKSPFVADQRHLHHRLLQAGLSHRFAVYVIYALTLWVGSLAITCVGVPYGMAILTSTTGLLAYTLWRAWQSIRQPQN